jgi:hypothetical protein
MQHYLGRIVLICRECGQRVVLLDPELIWQFERPVLECACGEELTLADRIMEGGPSAGAA